ncbi:GHKL domain-containing protein [Erysipelothrix sp. HDW6C]|uniref:sensor histidine kinase n=1 Tax=Erysipelothrix sp. HDW6C TaxID=2714930 RepID=UPI00140D66D5|nr:sensor histidine kinase [Erysipelothrix sp. HDW6C]QIK69454.1 GHKL domain-containing protein [Erysipelothrix sp. HDW6C]
MELFMNIPRFLTALAESMACLIIILSFTKKQPYWHLKFLGFAMGQIVLQHTVESWPLSFWILGMILNILWMYLTINFCVSANRTVIIYNTMKAFIFAEFSASFAWLLSLYFFASAHQTITPLILITAFIINTVSAAVYFFVTLRSKQDYTSVQSRSLLITLLTCTIIFMMSNLGFLLSTTAYPLGDTSAVFIFRTMIDVLGLAILYIQESQRRESNLQEEIGAINNALYYQYRQYNEYRQNNSMIDQKVHDLKHQLQLLNMEPIDATIKNRVLTDIEELIKQYDATIASGNPILDTVLTQKNLMCLQNNISFTCMTDGNQLNFMDALDIYSILGNALDNAFESVSKLEGNQRVINLRIFAKDDFVIISLENPYSGTLEYEDGFPRTTKKDTQYHGYGIKSMSYIVEKYHGNLSINDDDGWFKLKVLFAKQSIS